MLRVVDGGKALSRWEGWQMEPPQEDGFYWFNGWTSRAQMFRDVPPRLYCVHVYTIGGNRYYLRHGGTLNQRQMLGDWKRIEVPAHLPETEAYEETVAKRAATDPAGSHLPESEAEPQ